MKQLEFSDCLLASCFGLTELAMQRLHQEIGIATFINHIDKFLTMLSSTTLSAMIVMLWSLAQVCTALTLWSNSIGAWLGLPGCFVNKAF
jgi:hypothetical protein